MCQKQSDFSWCVLPPFPLATEGWRPRWVVSERISAEIVRGLQGQGDTGGLSERSVIREKGNHLSFYFLPQSRVVWISLTLRVTLKSCSNLTREWSVTTWLLSTWDMASKFRSVLKAQNNYNVSNLMNFWWSGCLVSFKTQKVATWEQAKTSSSQSTARTLG